MTEKKKKGAGEISRREFLKDAGLLAGGAAIGSSMLLTACDVTDETYTRTETITITQQPTDGTAPVAANTIKITVNGRAYEVQVEPGWTLQYLLKEKLGWNSVKDMCFGYGACGSCSVIMNGRPVLSCMNLAIECDGAVIETAEKIAEDNHPLVDAYVLNHCAQCGYCTPGFLVTAKALMDHNPTPTEEDIREALGGNICRCGTYPQHILAVLEASGQIEV